MLLFDGKKLLFFIVLAIAPSLAAAAPSGEDLYKEIIAGTPIYDDPQLADYIRTIGEEIVANSEMAGEPFTFTVLDSPEINAFATRGNYVYINRGLLSYINNEAQLVSVLAHEVGHITRKHVTGQESQATGAKALAAIAAILSGSGEVYEAGVAYSNSLIRSHGRNNELEADEAGAEYMARMGFDPEEMITMLSVMKDNEELQKKRAADRGAPRQTYHGIFSSHPRNDSRLRTAVSKAESLKSTGTRDNGVTRYRQMTEGLIWGDNFQEKEPKPERYSNMSWRVRIDFPEGWTHRFDAQGPVVIAEAESKDARLNMVPTARTAQSPEEFLYNQLNVSQLRDGKEIKPAGLNGFTGILPGEDGKPDRRIAVVYYKLTAYVFTGETREQKDFNDQDKLFLESIDTFRPISRREIEGQRPKKIHFVKATSATTFDALGQALKLDQYEVEDLRMINGYYPKGEPKPGDWIKIFRQ